MVHSSVPIHETTSSTTLVLVCFSIDTAMEWGRFSRVWPSTANSLSPHLRKEKKCGKLQTALFFLFLFWDILEYHQNVPDLCFLVSFSLDLCVLCRWRVRDDEEHVDGLADAAAAAPSAVGLVPVAVSRVTGPSDDGEAPAGALATVQDDRLRVLQAA